MLLGAGAALGQVAVNPVAPADDAYAPAKTAAELEARYTAILVALKNPPATGILIAELGPYSAGARAGLRPGDVVTEYDGTKLDNRADANRAEMLRVAVAKAIGESERPWANPQVALIVKRAGKTVVINADRQPLGLRALAVEAGVGLPPNPPATSRGSFALEWTPSGGWYHVGDVTGPDGAEQQEFAVVRQVATLTVATRVINAGGKIVADAQAATIRMNVSDRTTTYGVTLDQFTYRDELADVSAMCKAGMVKGTIVRRLTDIKQQLERPTLPEAICSLAVPSLAAALPQKENIVLPLAVIDELDLQTRMGYALETRGKATMTIASEARDGFSVRLWHFGQVEATYFFSPQRELIFAEYEAGVGGVKLLRAANEEAAIKALVTLPGTTRPTSAPATRPATVPALEVRAIDPAAGTNPGPATSPATRKDGP